jgi:RimJ/RimL family protein N-acetyltransferase
MLMRAYPKEAALKDGHRIVIRPLNSGDFDKLYAFFQALPEEDRLFLRHDVTSPEIVHKWVGQIDLNRAIPLVAEDGGKIVADGTLRLANHGWSRHVGDIRLVTARTHRGLGLGTVIARELVALAEERELEKLQVQVIEDNIGSVKMCERVGFKMEAVLKDLVKDQRGHLRNLAIMTNDVANLGQIMEDWIQDTMLPQFRVPGEGIA